MTRKPQPCDPTKFGLPAEAVEIVEPGGRGKPGRTKDAKHFHIPGKGSVAIFGRDLHYEAEPGVWEEVDPTILTTKAEHGKAVVDKHGDQFDLCCVRAPHKSYFRRNARAPQRMEVPGGGAIVLDPIGVENVQAVVEGNKITYPGAWPGVDWVRTIAPWGVKSEFVLHGPEAPNEFRFRLRLEGLSYGQKPDGTVEFYRGSELVAAMRPPTVADAAGVEGLVRQWIEPTAHGPELVVQVDRAWLDELGRAWPVLVDPTTTFAVTTGADDNWVRAQGTTWPPTSPSVQGGSFPRAERSLGSGLYYIGVALVRWDTSSLPDGAIILSATLRVSVYASANNNSRSFAGEWYEPGTIGAEDWTNTVSSSAFLAAIPGAGVTKDYTLSNPDANVSKTGYTGLRLHITDGTAPTNWNYVQLIGYEYSTTDAPRLIVSYSSPPTASSPTPGGTSTSPARVNTTTPRLSWTFSDPDGDTQAAYQVIITRDSDGMVVKDTGEVASANAYYDVPAGILAAGVKYRWKVRVKDSAGLWSTYTSEVYIYTNRAPSATPTSPLGTSTSPAIISNSTTPRLQWSFSDPDGDAQQEFRVIITRASDNAVIRDTGWIASPNQYWDVPAGDLAYGVTYYWQVQVSDPYGLQSALTTPQYFQPNRTPNAPTGLSPAGTVADPAEVCTLMPTLTWTHNDPDLEPQYSFQVLIYRASDNALVRDSGEVVSGTSSYTVPANVLSGSTKYYWRVRTKDTGSLLFGPYSSDAYIYTNQAPYAPTNLSPASGAVFDATTAKRFSWTFQDPDIVPNGDAQSAFQVLIYRVSDGVLVHDSGKVVSGNQYYDLPANTLVNGVNYQWQVRTWDLQDQVGPYSSLASFRTGRPPAVSITSPADAGTYGKGILTVQWSYSDPDTDPQVQYQAVLKTGAGMVIEDSGIIASAATQHQFATILSNNTQYQVTVAVWDATGQSATDTNAFTTSFVPPTTPVLGLVADDVGDKIVLTITNPDNDPAKPATARNDLYRRKQGEVAWTRIAKALPQNGGYDDYAVASGAVYEYKVVAISVDETTAESAVQSGGVSFLGVWLHDPADPANTARHFLYDGRAREEVWEPEAELLQFAGRTLPVAEFGQQTDERVRVTLQLLGNSGDLEMLRTLARRRTILCYRDGTGRKVFGVVTALPVSDQPYGAEVTVEVTSVAYSEAV